MLRRVLSLLTLPVFVVFLPAGAQQLIPETPAGHTLKAWLDAFNSGDRASEEKYLHTYDPTRSLDNEMRFRGMTGGFVLLQIIKSDPLRRGIHGEGPQWRNHGCRQNGGEIRPVPCQNLIRAGNSVIPLLPL